MAYILYSSARRVVVGPPCLTVVSEAASDHPSIRSHFVVRHTRHATTARNQYAISVNLAEVRTSQCSGSQLGGAPPGILEPAPACIASHITSAETRRPYLKRHARERADSDPYARACHFHELDPGMVTFTPTDAQTVFPLTGTCAAEIAR